MQINMFDGGLSTRVDPSLLESNEAVEYSNINNTSKILASAKGYTSYGTEARGNIYLFGTTWLNSVNERSYVEYRKKLYFTEAGTKPKKFSNSVYSNLGIEKPVHKAAVTLDTGVPILDANNTQYIGLVPELVDLVSTDFISGVVNLAEGTLAAATYEYRLVAKVDSNQIAYFDFSQVAVADSSVKVSFKTLHTFDLYRKHTDNCYYKISSGRYSLTDTGAALNTDATNKLSIVTPGYTFANFFTETISAGSLTASTYYYRLAIMDGSTHVQFFDRTVTPGASKRVTYDFPAIGNTVRLYKRHSDGFYYKLKEGTHTLFDNAEALDTTLGNRLTASELEVEEEVVQYSYTYYNSTDGVESAPSDIGAEITWPLNKKIKLSNFTVSSDPQVDQIKLYRLGFNVTTLSLVDTIANAYGPIYDLKLGSEVGAILDSYNYLPAPTDLKYLVEAYGIMFAALDTDLRFTPVGKPDYWPEENSIPIRKAITGILPMPQGLLIFTIDRAYLLAGSSASDFNLVDISSEQGCISHRSCKLIKNIPVWISADGICSFEGGAATCISKNKLGKLSLNVINTTVYDETYYVLKSNGSILAMDLRFNTSFAEYHLGLPIKDLHSTNTILYGAANDKLITLFDGAELNLVYLSPKFSEGSVTQEKLYNNVYMKINGVFTVKMFIDDKEVYNRSHSGDKVLDLSAEAEEQRGYTIQFSIQGKGKVHEIEYKVVGRQNGR